MRMKEKKITGRGDSQMAKLKNLWRHLPPDERVYWQDLFVSNKTQEAIRDELLEKLGVHFNWDNQVNIFRHWELEQRELDLEAERQEEDERRFLEEHPEWSLDKARSAVLKKAYLRANAKGDFRLGLAVIHQELSVQSLVLDREKLELLKRKAAQAEETEKVLQKPTMTPEERQAAIKAIYGRG